MPTLEFGKIDFNNGQANTDASASSGLSPYLKGCNLRYRKGVLAPQASKENVTATTSLASKTAVVVGDGTSSGGIGYMLLSEDSTKDGHIFSVEVTEGVIGAQSTEDTGRDYDIDKIDCIHDADDLYTSSNTDISKGGGNLGAVDWDWGSTTGGMTIQNGSVHHFFQFQKYLYITNGTNIYRSASGGGTPFTEKIIFNWNDAVTCAIPHNGKIYICIMNDSELAYGKKTKMQRMAIWDGDSALPDSETNLPARCYSMFSYNGKLLLFFEKFIGYYNGLNIDAIWDLNGTSPVYKGKIKQIDDVLYFIDGADIMAFDGSKFWCYYTGSANIDTIWNLIGDNLDFIEGDNAYKFDLFDIDGTGKASSLPIEFPQKVAIQKIKLFLDEDMVSGDSNTIKIYDEGDTLVYTGTATFANDGAIRFKEFGQNGGNLCRLDTMRIVLDTFSNLVKRVLIKYAPIDEVSTPK